MTPILLSRALISDQAWDNHISQSGQCVIYALSWYLDIVCDDWQALVLPGGEHFSAVMPLPVTRKFGKLVLYQPLFCQYLGLFSKQELTPDHFNAFFHALATHFDYISSYSFNPENFQVMQRMALPGHFVFTLLQTHWLDLDRHYEDVFNGYAKDRKVNLRKGLSYRWVIREPADPAHLIRLFTLNHAPGIGKIRAHAYRILEQLVKCCHARGHASLYYALDRGNVHAGVLIAHYRNRAIYLFNAADSAGRRGNARAVILDAYFRKNEGHRLNFDFETPDKPTIAAHYKSYGSKAMPFYSMKRNALPFPFRPIQQCRKWLLINTRRYLSGVLCRI